MQGVNEDDSGIVGKPIVCGDYVGVVVRQTGDWHSTRAGDQQVVVVAVLGEVYRNVYAVRRDDGSLAVDHGMPQLRKGKVA